jgi:hypothetical protein
LVIKIGLPAMSDISLTQPTSSMNRGKLLVSGIVVVAVLFGAALIFLKNQPNSNSYKAIFLSNGQVYFDKISERGWQTVTMNEVYYFQLKNTTTSAVAGDDLSLIKLGNELHGPEDSLEINWDHILFIESLRRDSRIVGAIEKYQRR